MEKNISNVYEYIWSKEFPNEELNYDDFYDWSRENASRALELSLEYCDLNNESMKEQLKEKRDLLKN